MMNVDCLVHFSTPPLRQCIKQTWVEHHQNNLSSSCTSSNFLNTRTSLSQSTNQISHINVLWKHETPSFMSQIVCCQGYCNRVVLIGVAIFKGSLEPQDIISDNHCAPILWICARQSNNQLLFVALGDTCCLPMRREIPTLIIDSLNYYLMRLLCSHRLRLKFPDSQNISWPTSHTSHNPNASLLHDLEKKVDIVANQGRLSYC